MVSFRLTDPLTDNDFLAYYQKIKSDPDFYTEKYGEALFSEKAYVDLAEYLVKYLKPRTAVDIGCCSGKLVGALRSLGVDARGFDFIDLFSPS